ncbi:MAG: alpha/beta hydrolase [Ilumatobacteraceae bacterium]|nr:alpha/beta hydrolase [Ilumatobacteraceae bacterium]
MSASDLIDPESRVPLDLLLQMMPGGFNAIADLPTRRQALDAVVAEMSKDAPRPDHVVSEDHTVPGLDGDPDLWVRVYRNTSVTGPTGGLYFIHGGGMVLGSVQQSDLQAITFCDQLGCTVVSVEYRLAPEHPHPAPVRNCYAGLRWTAEHAAELGIDPDRLVIHGPSAGGGLCIATSMMARDHGGPALALQVATYPMIDDRNETPSSHLVTDVGIWDRSANIEAWAWYLGGAEADQYAAPARATDLAGLPPTFIDVGTVDLFRDEDLAFAARLVQAGVPTELHLYPGAYHASEGFAPTAALSQRIMATRLDAMRRALG